MFLIFLIVLVLLAVVCLGLAFAIDRQWQRRRQEITDRYKPDVLFCEEQFLGFRFSERKLFVGTINEEHEYTFDQITKCEVMKDNVTTISTDRGSQLAGAVVGGALLGAPGALIGGLSSSKTSKENLKSVILKLYVDDPAHPVHDVCFFAATGNGKGGNREGIGLADQFYAHCLNAMRAATTIEPARQSSNDTSPASYLDLCQQDPTP
jgi:hypothetical protein